MRNQLEWADICEYSEVKLNAVLINHIPELEFCYEHNKVFAKWYDDKFCKYTQKVDNNDLRCLLESVNNCLSEMPLQLELRALLDRQAKEAEELASKIREELIKPFCDEKGYDFISGMGCYFFTYKNGGTIDFDKINHPTITAILEADINEKFSVGDYVQSYTPLNGYTAKRIKKDPEGCKERNIKLSL